MPFLMQKRPPLGLVAKGAVRPDFIIASPPCLTFSLCIGQAQEPVCIQASRPDKAITAINERIVRGLSKAAEVLHDTMLIGPQIKVLRYEFGAIAHSDPMWTATSPSNTLKRIDNINPLVTVPEIQCRLC